MTGQDDWLWDGSGEPDDELAEIANALRPLAYDGDPPALPARGGHGWWPGLLLAAAVLLVVSAAWWMQPAPEAPAVVAAEPVPAPAPLVAAQPESPKMPTQPAPAPGSMRPGWDGPRVTQLDAWEVEGTPNCNSIGEGNWLETGETTATVAIADIGQMRVEPGTKVRLVHSTPDEHRLELLRGRISASVDAPPRLLVLQTPSVTAVDLGCAYNLAVDDAGNTDIHVLSGYVALEDPRRSVWVPADALAHTRLDQGPGTPYFDDAPPDLRQALSELDFGPRQADSLDRAMGSARLRDTLSLIELLPALSRAERGLVYDKVVELTPHKTARKRLPRRKPVIDLDGGAIENLRDVQGRYWYREN